jgi:starch synthase (maltosyl-transferring)
VNLDPHLPQDGGVCLALDDDPIPADETYTVRDALDGRDYVWTGPWNYVRLDPAERPAHVMVADRPRVRP